MIVYFLFATGLYSRHYCILRERCRLYGQRPLLAVRNSFLVLPGKLLPGKLLPGKLLPGKLLPGKSLPGKYTVCACLLVIRNFSCYQPVKNFKALNGNENEGLTPISHLES